MNMHTFQSSPDSRIAVLIACVFLSFFAVSTSCAIAADGTVDSFTAKISSKQMKTTRGKVVLVKSVVLRGSGLLQGRPQIKCEPRKCLRLRGKKYSRSKFYKPKVTFKNANLLVKRGQSLTIRLVPNDKNLLGRYVTFSLKKKGKLQLRETASGCITGGGKLTPCPAPPTGLNCNRPAANPNTNSLAPYLGGLPKGSVDAVSNQVSNSINVQGWTFDPDQPEIPIWVHAYLDGVFAGAYLAELPRADVNSIYVGANSNHGFSFNIPNVASGTHTLTIYAIDLQGVSNPSLWSGPVPDIHTAQLGSPFGAVESGVAVDCGTVELTGWTADPSGGSLSTDVHVYIDGWPGHEQRALNAGLANLPRPDIAAGNPGYSAERGFRVRVTDLSPGPHIFYVYGINAGGSGENLLLRATTVNVP